MRFKAYGLVSSILLLTSFPTIVCADEPPAQTKPAFTPFTGKVTRNKVRLRLQPNLDGQILKELVRDDMLVVVGDEDEFYAVEPPKGTKVYVYRTFVIDNIVEGRNVNVRLEPDTEAPVVAQLTTGDKIDGVVSPLNSKWLEITPPPSAHFYVCKEYIDNIGDAGTLAKMEKRKEEVNSLLNSTQLISQSELQKPFEEMQLDTVFNNLSKITQLYKDFPDQVSRAKEMLARIQEVYTQKKIAYLEAKAASLGHIPLQSELSLQMRNQQEELDRLENTMDKAPIYSTVTIESPTARVAEASLADRPVVIDADWNEAFVVGSKTEQMASWIPIEETLYTNWASSNGSVDPQSYYQNQATHSVVVRGIIEPYQRSIRGKPGDYILVNKGTNLPVAYLYSTQINLQEFLGKELTLRVAPRPNNNFAFPAYFVLAVE